MKASSKACITAFVTEDHFKEVRDVMQPQGVEVIHAQHLKQAVEASPNVVVCDDVVDGSWQRTIRRILEFRPDARVVLLSRVADDRMWVDALSAGAHDLLPDPCAARDLCATVLVALGLQRYRVAA